MGQLDYISVRGFRSLKAVEKLPLSRINVLIGANGSGKSNFVKAFELLRAVRDGELSGYTLRHGGADEILFFGSKESESIFLEISASDGKNGYKVELAQTQNDQLFPQNEVVWFWDKPKHAKPYSEYLPSRGNEASISEPDGGKIKTWVRAHLAGWRIYHFHDTSTSSPIKKTSNVDDNRFFRPDGSNIASYLYLLRSSEQAAYNLIVKSVQQVAPFFKDFQLAPQALDNSKIRLEWRHKYSDKYFDASSLSDGTLRFICLATLFLQPKSHKPSIILLDEPELGLHPYAISLLASLIKSASAETQVIVATQSPIFLDHFEPEDVLVAEQSEGATSVRRLEEAPLKEWLEEYSLGQLWEKNNLGGRPLRG